MNTSTINFEIPDSRIDSLVGELRESIKADCGTEYSETAIKRSVIEWLDSRLDVFVEDALDRLTSPSYDDARNFARLLDQAEPEMLHVPAMAEAEAGLTIFNGYRSFSLEKMAAMVSHLASRTTDLYKTKLNKLLFYADFVNYYLHGASISGSRYVHLPYGPVPDGYEETLETLNHYGVIDVTRQDSAELVRSGDTPAKNFLSSEELESVDWVLNSYGNMSASQLTELSHRERAYRNTKSGEEIAYEYAKFLAKLPTKTA
jgi:uncharacterized phage-associated protein